MATGHLPQIEALMSRIAEMRAAHHEPSDIFPRTPDTISTQSISADNIERGLRADGHRIWGFVVYRCTYTSDSAWEACIQRINASIRKSMTTYNGHGLLEEERFKLTVLENATKFDGASTSAVRQHFTEWCARALHQEHGSREEIESRRQEQVPWYGSLAVRYRFCVQIDEASMQSILCGEHEAWIHLIRDDRRMQEATSEEKAKHEPEGNGVVEDEGDLTNDDLDDLDEEYPAIEGCTEEDVGWMKVEYGYVILTFYDYLRSPNGWLVMYRRPPDVVAA